MIHFHFIQLGHLSKSNDDIVEEFVHWTYSLEIEDNKLIGQPQIIPDLSNNKDYIEIKSGFGCKMDRKDEAEWARGIC